MDKQSLTIALISTFVSASTILVATVSSAKDPRLFQLAGQDRETSLRHEVGRHRMVPRLYDARGQIVGDVVAGSNNNGTGAVLLNVEGVLVLAEFVRMGSESGESASQMQWLSGELDFGGPNCTGEPYIRYTGTPLRPTTAYSRNSHVTLLIAVEGRQEVRRIVSFGDSTGCYGDNIGYLDSVWRVERSINLTEKYPEPLRVGW
ncbi:hypothetical protein [Caballeronia grimmiae]|uniref:hypothetical protein n=1 Tax=Caballeronia grimmiae TaxID=1071679 RepID=UPI0038BD2937